MEAEILEAVQIYLSFTGEAENFDVEFLSLIISSVIESYKQQRCYPDDTEDEVIEADVNRYFSMKKSYVTTQVIPAILGKVGGEGLTSIIDNQTSRYWKTDFPVYLPDVVPYCEVV